MVTVLPAVASVHDIHLYTDSTPDYVSIEDFVATATGAWAEPEDQAIALWRWMTRGHLQASTTFEDGRPIWDPMEFYGSYPNTFCGYHAAFLTAFVDAMGGDWRHRYVELSDHTVCEVSWDAGASWHMFDASMVVYARRHDGAIASCSDIAAADQCALSALWGAAGPEPGHLYFYHAAPECVTNPPDPRHPELDYPSGYRKAADCPVEFVRTLRGGADSYIAGFEAQELYTHVRRGWVNRLHLHPGHVYTRYWRPLGAGAAYARLDAYGDDPNDSFYPANIRGNGRWEIRPDLRSANPRGGWYQLAGVVHRDHDGGQGPALRPAAGVAEAALVVKVDAANVLTSGQVYLAGLRGGGDAVTLEVSRDAGCTWVIVAQPAAGAFAGWHALDADVIGGVHELLVRVRLRPDATRLDCGVDDLRIEAVTQLNRMTLPRLQRGANQVRFASGLPQETLTLHPALQAGAEHGWAVSADSYAGLTASSDHLGYANAILMPTLAYTPGVVTWRIDTPTDVQGFTFGGSFIALNGGAGNQVRLRYSWDGVSFATAGTFDADSAPTWDGRLYASPASIPVGARSVWLQYDMRSSLPASGQSTGLQEALLQVHHAPQDPTAAPVAVTWCWTEHRTTGDVTRQHTHLVEGADEIWTIDVGGHRDPTMEWVRVELAGAGTVPGYDDGIDVGPGYGYDKVRITAGWEDDLALGRPYTVSRPASSTNPDTGGRELTDGVVIPPTAYAGAYFVQGQVAQWAGDAPLTVTVDLGAERQVRALRVTSHQPGTQFCHAGTITAYAVTDAGTAPLGVIQHDDIWSPPGDHLDWGYVRSEEFAGLPAEGRLAYGYWLVLAEPTTARAIRLDVLPLAGHGVGLSEIQVFSAATVADWPDREVDLGGGTTAVREEPRVASSSPARLLVAPNPANPGTTITYELAAGADVSLRVIDVRGRVVRTLVQGWRPAGTHRARWDGRDDAGRAVASGRYLAACAGGGKKMVGSVTVVR